MPTNFPASLDTGTQLPSAATLAAQNENVFPHSAVHGNADDAILAIETKLGINSSADTSSIDYKVNNIAITQLPVGTTSSTVAAGDQAANLIAQLPTVDTDDHAKATFTTVNNVTFLGMANLLATTNVGTGSGQVVEGGVITAGGPQGDAAHTQVLTWNAAGQLTAVTNTAIALAASAVTSGTFAIGRIPTGTTSSTVPLGGVITAAGPTGGATTVPVITYNAAGQLTAVTTASVSGAGIDTSALHAANNLSDVNSVSTSKTNLKVGYSTRRWARNFYR